MGAEEGKGAGDLGLFICLGDELVDHFFEGLDIVVGLALFDLDTKATGVTETRDGRRRDNDDLGFLDCGKPFLQLGNDPIKLLGFFFSFVPWFELHEYTTAIRFDTKGQDVKTSQCGGVGDSGDALSNMLDAVQDRQGSCRRAGFGDLKGDIQTAVIFCWNKAGWFFTKQEDIPDDDTGQQHNNEWCAFYPACDPLRIPGAEAVE